MESCEEDIIIYLDFHQSLLILYQLLSFGCPLKFEKDKPLVDIAQRRSLARKEVRCCRYLRRWGKSSSDNSLLISAVSTSNGLEMLGAIIQPTSNCRVVLFYFALLGLTLEIIIARVGSFSQACWYCVVSPLPKHQGLENIPLPQQCPACLFREGAIRDPTPSLILLALRMCVALGCLSYPFRKVETLMQSEISLARSGEVNSCSSQTCPQNGAGSKRSKI